MEDFISHLRDAGGVSHYDIVLFDCPPGISMFAEAAIEDLRWLGLKWTEGPDVGGPHTPYIQSQRLPWFRDVWSQFQATGTIYPCDKSRKDVERSLTAPHAEDDAEPIFPPSLRPPLGAGREAHEPGPTNWRFRVPDGETIAFEDFVTLRGEAKAREAIAAYLELCPFPLKRHEPMFRGAKGGALSPRINQARMQLLGDTIKGDYLFGDQPTGSWIHCSRGQKNGCASTLHRIWGSRASLLAGLVSIAIAMAICVVLMIVFIGALLMPVVGVLNVVFCIIAAVKANNGEYYRYPFTLRLIK